MTQYLWLRIALLVVGVFAYIGIGHILVTLICKSKRSEFGPNYLWLYFWPLPVVIIISAGMIILVAIALIITLAVGFILGVLGTTFGFAGGFLGVAIVLFFTFVALLVVLVVVTSPFEGFEFFLSGIKKLPGCLIGSHKMEQIGHKERIEKHQT